MREICKRDVLVIKYVNIIIIWSITYTYTYMQLSYVMHAHTETKRCMTVEPFLRKECMEPGEHTSIVAIGKDHHLLIIVSNCEC